MSLFIRYENFSNHPSWGVFKLKKVGFEIKASFLHVLNVSQLFFCAVTLSCEITKPLSKIRFSFKQLSLLFKSRIWVKYINLMRCTLFKKVLNLCGIGNAKC